MLTSNPNPQPPPSIPTNSDAHTSLDANIPRHSPRAVSHLSPPASLDLDHSAPNPAAEMRRCLTAKWFSREAWKGYTPQLGFDPSTGEPWMSVRCYADNAYPALAGSHHRYLQTLSKQIPEFEIRYERFPNYILIWPEFKDVLDLSKKDVWDNFNRLRAFLVSWASTKREVPIIFKAHREWLTSPADRGRRLDVPDRFLLEESRGFLARSAMQDRADRRMRGEIVEEPEVEKFPRKTIWPDRPVKRMKNRGEESGNGGKSIRQDNPAQVEEEGGRGSMQGRGHFTQRRGSPLVIDRYRPAPRDGAEDMYERQRSCSRGMEKRGIDQYRPPRSQNERRSVDRYRPQH